MVMTNMQAVIKAINEFKAEVAKAHKAAWDWVAPEENTPLVDKYR